MEVVCQKCLLGSNLVHLYGPHGLSFLCNMFFSLKILQLSSIDRKKPLGEGWKEAFDKSRPSARKEVDSSNDFNWPLFFATEGPGFVHGGRIEYAERSTRQRTWHAFKPRQ